MHSEKLTRRLGLILFLAAAALTWLTLDRAEPRADWLRVEAPRIAVVGQSFPLRVHLAPLTEPSYLVADLHWTPARDTAMKYLATGGPKAVGKGGGDFVFEIAVPPRPGLRFVSGVIYLGPTGNWGDHKLSTSTELIPVAMDTAPAKETRLELLHLKPPADIAPDHPHPAAAPRWLTGLLFLAALITAWRAASSNKDATGRPGPAIRGWHALLILLALACLWETFGLEGWLGERARAIAHAEDFYYPRAALQKFVISTAVAATILFFLCLRRVRPSHRLLLVSLTLYLALALVNLMSLHAIDQVAGLCWHGLTLVQVLKLACAALTLQGVRRAS
jgi:hypothetical protein